MSELKMSLLKSEWQVLQTQFDSYEKCSLGIKLVSILSCCVLLFLLNAGLYTTLVVAIFWLQDGIWKTFQSRIGERLETVEQAIQDSQNAEAAETSTLGMQFNLAWNQSRPSATGLISEYLKHCLKPTVAYPYIVLIALVLLQVYRN